MRVTKEPALTELGETVDRVPEAGLELLYQGFPSQLGQLSSVRPRTEGKTRKPAVDALR